MLENLIQWLGWSSFLQMQPCSCFALFHKPFVLQSLPDPIPSVAALLLCSMGRFDLLLLSACGAIGLWLISIMARPVSQALSHLPTWANCQAALFRGWGVSYKTSDSRRWLCHRHTLLRANLFDDAVWQCPLAATRGRRWGGLLLCQALNY